MEGEYKAMFRTENGLIIPRQFTNKHHTLWRKDWYRTPIERKTREMAGMVLRLSIDQHQELHSAIEPPAKPNTHLLRAMHNYNMHNLDSLSSYDRFEAVTELLGRVAATGGRNARDAGLLHDNFEEQMPFVQAGRVEVYRGN
jgi:hypothetical protein